MLGIAEELLERESSVSSAVALEMAGKGLELMNTDVGVSTTGVAGRQVAPPISLSDSSV